MYIKILYFSAKHDFSAYTKPSFNQVSYTSGGY